MLVFSQFSKNKYDRLPKDLFGYLATPRDRTRPEHALKSGMVWAMDNYAYSGFDAESFMSMLERYKELPKPLWVTAPDVVGDAMETLRLFHYWQYTIRRYSYPTAFVAQDGLEQLSIPWGAIDCLFIGGSTEWKLGAACRRIVAEAKRQGKWVHMGRVNSNTRIRYAQLIGCDSVDGSGYARFTNDNVPRAIPYLRTKQMSFQQMLI